MKKELSITEYAESINDKPENVRGRIRTIDGWKKQLEDLETEAFDCRSLDYELKMTKLKFKIKNAINYYREDGHIFVLVDENVNLTNKGNNT